MAHLYPGGLCCGQLWSGGRSLAYPARMIGRIASGIALASMAGLMLAGCGQPVEPVESTPATDPSPEASSTRATEARAAWDAYQTRLSELGREPSGAALDPLLEVATAEHARFLLENFEAAADRRIHTEGRRRTISFEVDEARSDSERLRVMVCEDLSEERLMGDEGQDLTPADQADPRSRAVELVEAEERGGYVVATVTAYDGPSESDPCP